MKKLMITVILAIVCQITFAKTTFYHERGERRWHEREYCRTQNYFRPRAEIIVSRPCERVYNPYQRFWIRGQWVITGRGYERWVPAHWSY
jgi:hypothetical protein